MSRTRGFKKVKRKLYTEWQKGAIQVVVQRDKVDWRFWHVFVVTPQGVVTIKSLRGRTNAEKFAINWIKGHY